MADPIPWEIADAFRQVGVLWAREQAAGDDEGVGQVEQIAGLLRTYAQHEQADGDQSIDGCSCAGPCCC